MPNYYPYLPQFYPQQAIPMPTQMPQAQVSQQAAPSQAPQNTTPTIQDGGFVTVPSEDIVYGYPVAIGKCVTFKIEGKPIIMEKSVGFSQFEEPKIVKYRLEKEESEEEHKASEERKKSTEEIDSIKAELLKIWGELNNVKEITNRKNQQPTQNQKRERNGEP